MVEIYPRALTGKAEKPRWGERHAYLLKRFPEQPKNLPERAAGSEDAFDAAVSALVMSEHEAELQTLPNRPPLGMKSRGESGDLSTVADDSRPYCSARKAKPVVSFLLQKSVSTLPRTGSLSAAESSG